MSIKTVVSVFSVAFIFSVVGNSAKAPGISESPLVRYRIPIPRQSGKQQVLEMLNSRGFDIAGVNLKQMTVDIITEAQGIKTLELRGLQGKIISTSDRVKFEKFGASQPERYKAFRNRKD
jgi:hypothetical protein